MSMSESVLSERVRREFKFRKGVNIKDMRSRSEVLVEILDRDPEQIKTTRRYARRPDRDLNFELQIWIAIRFFKTMGRRLAPNSDRDLDFEL